MDVLREERVRMPEETWNKRNDSGPDNLIELSRAAVARARAAVAIAQEFDRDREARGAEIRKLRADAERAIERLENEVEDARKLLSPRAIVVRRG